MAMVKDLSNLELKENRFLIIELILPVRTDYSRNHYNSY